MCQPVPKLLGECHFLLPFLPSARPQQNARQHVVRLVDLVIVARDVFGQGDRLARRCLGLRFATSIRVHMPEKKQRIGVLRFECGGADQFAFCLLQAVLLHRDVSEQVVTAVVFGVDPEFSPQLRHSFRKARLIVAVQVGECEKIVRLRYSVVLGDGFLEFLDRVVQGLRLSFAISTTEVNMNLCCISQPRDHFFEQQVRTRQIV